MNKEITIASVGNEHIEKFLSEERDLFYTLLERIIALTAIHPMYTYEHNNTEFSNGLSFKKYQIWNSSNAIDEMIKRKMRITEYIQIVPKKCKACSPHSCKVFADGRIGLCDAMYHSNEFPAFDEAIQNIGIVNNYFAEIKNYKAQCYCFRSDIRLRQEIIYFKRIEYHCELVQNITFTQ